MSVRDWKKMRRKQQELVLKVWENMLETMKFRAAKGKGDFGTSLDGMYSPKDTPFDTALQALKEMCGEPNYFEPCPGCVFLGSYKSGPPSMQKAASPDEPAQEKDTWYDLYYCNQGSRVNKPMLSARFGDAPKPDESYSVAQMHSAAFDAESTIGQDLRYISAAPGKCKHPVLKRARGLALELDLITEEQCFPPDTLAKAKSN
jgi:hypothetical protein